MVLFLDLVMDNDNPDCTVGATQPESAQELAVFSQILLSLFVLLLFRNNNLILMDQVVEHQNIYPSLRHQRVVEAQNWNKTVCFLSTVN